MTYPVWHLAGVNSGLIVAVVSRPACFCGSVRCGRRYLAGLDGTPGPEGK